MNRQHRAGFALRELICVAATLLCLVLVAGAVIPQLAQPRLTTACAQNIRHILQGMAAWANENNDYIVGSPSTSGYSLIEGFEVSPPQVPDFEDHRMKTF